MRFAPLLTIAAALTFASVGMAEAQTASSTTTTTTTKQTTTKVSKPRTKIVITKRSPLDAGTVVKPGSKSYLDYALPAEYNYPTYGAGQASIVPGRYPLPDRFYLPGY
ncbi:hypothetical protein [Roseixanthobacter glucoisosaccharinicivorans]|uniref:hypothetical protein n=1 Tax=Roseixanthobacter glucoisosaccharinicivorans TaxID=3119923 RepID=UPI0037280DD0